MVYHSACLSGGRSTITHPGTIFNALPMRLFMTTQALDDTRLRDYGLRIEADLCRNILPFWINHVVNRTNGSFHGALTNEGVVDDTVERGALLTSRILWTYSAAYRQYRDPAYLAMADYAYADMQSHFRDCNAGGYFWSIQADGTVLRDRKQVYGQAFAVYALAEYYAASNVKEALDEAITVFRLIETKARDVALGGYFEAFDRDWQPIDDMRLSAVDLNAPKSQNTLLHVMEAYTNLLLVWPDETLHRALANLVEIMLQRVVGESSGHLGLFFTADWQPLSNKISYGHDIEAAWLLTAAAEALADAKLTARIHALAVHIADVTLAEGVDADGALFYEGDHTGITDSNKEWWPQAEAVIGFLNAYRLAGDARYLAAAFRVWDFTEEFLVDQEYGEWFRAVNRNGELLADPLKVSFWKCPYHNGRMGLEAVRRLSWLHGR